MADKREGVDEAGQMGTEEAQKYAKLEQDQDLARDLADAERPYQDLALFMEKVGLPDMAAKAREYAIRAAGAHTEGASIEAEQIQKERAFVEARLALGVKKLLVDGQSEVQIYAVKPDERDHSDLIYELSGVARPTNWGDQAQLPPDVMDLQANDVESPLGYSIREVRPSEDKPGWPTVIKVFRTNVE